jgi:hypothetical protein
VRYQRASHPEGEIHPVAGAVQLYTSGGGFAVAAADELGLKHGFGVAVRPQQALDPDLGAVEEAGRRPAWRALVGRRIAETRLHWEGIFERLRPSLSIGVCIHADHLSRTDYPQTLELGLEGGARVYLSAAALKGDGTAVGFVNHLLVVFSEETARRLRLVV